MIITTRPDVTEAQLDAIRERVESLGLRTHMIRGQQRTIIGCIGDDARLADVALLTMPGVETVTPVLKPYKLASREFGGGQSIINIGDRGRCSVGGRELAVIAGPCSVESPEMLLAAALGVRQAGAVMLRGGAFKPRTSPYSFQGLGEAALEMLRAVRAQTGLPV